MGEELVANRFSLSPLFYFIFYLFYFLLFF